MKFFERFIVQRQPGQVTVLALVFLAIILAGSVALIDRSAIHTKKLRQTARKEQTLALAEAGLNAALVRINSSTQYSSEQFALGEGEVLVTVTNIDNTTKKITVKGAIPSIASPREERVIETFMKLDRPVDDAPFHYAVQVGNGGLKMENNTTVVGSVYSNGSIIGDPGARITGDALVAEDLEVLPLLEQTLQDQTITAGKIAAQEDWAQQFVLPSGGLVYKAQIEWRKIVAPSTAVVGIATNNNGQPSALLVSKSYSYFNVPDNFTWFDVEFDSPVYLQAGVPYWLVINAGSPSQYWYWELKATVGSAYNGGNAYSGTEWNNGNMTDSGKDLAFKIFQGSENMLYNVDVGTERGQENFGNAHGPRIERTTVANNVYATVFYNGTIGEDAYVSTATFCTVGDDIFYAVSETCNQAGQSTGGQPPPELPEQLAFSISSSTIDTWKVAAQTGGVYEGDYIVEQNETEWLGPLEITGDLELENGSTLIMQDTIYVHGDLEFGTNCSLQLDSTYGPFSGALVVDGKIEVENNCTFGSLGEGGYVVLASTDTSLDVVNNPSIKVSNNAETVIFYAPFGSILLNNNVQVQSAAAFQIRMKNGAVLEYEMGLAGAKITSGPAVAWTLDKGTYKIIK
ncbi:MAG TPA: hypothetical protein DDW36_03130 [Candidatus Magasanikbacteria bacterium]|nr:hypothetical protein [Candidatus Magasanikbacteria bacterium]